MKNSHGVPPLINAQCVGMEYRDSTAKVSLHGLSFFCEAEERRRPRHRPRDDFAWRGSPQNMSHSSCGSWPARSAAIQLRKLVCTKCRDPTAQVGLHGMPADGTRPASSEARRPVAACSKLIKTTSGCL